MKKTILLFLIVTSSVLNINSQIKKDTIKENSIWYADVTIGGSGAKGGGFLTGFSINYQHKKNLFTFRNYNNVRLDGFILFPIPFIKEVNNEYGFLYGRRHVNKTFSYSYSAGISYSEFQKRLQNSSFKTTNSIGFPLEFNIKWFKNKKSPYRIYELIPVGNPSALGNSIGFKFLANVSEIPYVGIGLTIGIGKYKIYN